MTEHVSSSVNSQVIEENQTRIRVNYNRFVIDGTIPSEVFADLERVYSIFDEEVKFIEKTMKESGDFEEDDHIAPEQVLVGGLFRDFCAVDRPNEVLDSIIPIIVSIHANLDKENFKRELENNFIQINLSALLEQFGFNADELATAMGIEIIPLNKPIRLDSIDDLPSFIPDEVKQQMIQLRDEMINNGAKGGTHMIDVTPHGVKEVTKEDFDAVNGEGSFDASLAAFKMDIEGMSRGAHEAPKTIQ